MTKKAPSIESALETADVISRRLEASGVKMSTADASGVRTVGIYAYRVGYSKDVGVSYWAPCFNRSVIRESHSEFVERVDALSHVRELLTGWGYVVDDGPGIYIACNRP